MDSFWEELQRDTGRFSGFENLMPFRVRDILLVASLFDAYTLEEGGRLTELLLTEYRELHLSFSPHVTRVSTGEEALALLARHRFDLVITMTRLGDMEATALARAVKARHPELPVVLLAFNSHELARLSALAGPGGLDRVFLWSGDARILLAIIKNVEDLRNAEHDSREGDVRVILLVEDSVRFYSVYLPLLYTEVVEHTQALLAEGLNLSHRLLRMRARPKILLASSFEEAWDLYRRHRQYLLGVISDARFPREGRKVPEAGVEFLRRIKADDPELPAALQSSEPGIAARAAEVGAAFIAKESAHLLRDLRQFLRDQLGFGDFVFRLPDGREVARAGDLRTLTRLLAEVPDESLLYHAGHDHFSNWLRARTEFALAAQIRPRKIDEFRDAGELRRYLHETFARFREEAQRGVVADFSRRLFDGGSDFVRIGGGSLGGKARGLAFMNSVLNRFGVGDRFPGVAIQVPPTAVIATDVFDEFLEYPGLRRRLLGDADDERVAAACLRAPLPRSVMGDLEAFLRQVRYPLAVRSSSLLEDSQFQPFAGVYSTYMLPNNHPDLTTRIEQLSAAIRLVYASTFFRGAKSYLQATGNRVEEEKMAVIVQQVVGRQHERTVYPDFAGVGHSQNFYPVAGLRAGGGVAFVALGLGRTVVDGGKCLRFSPQHPQVLPQLSTVKDVLHNSQREFLAVDVSRPDVWPQLKTDTDLVTLRLEDAERHGTLDAVGSVYSPENEAVYDGLGRPGARLVTFAPVLKHDVFPLAPILSFLLELGQRAMSSPVEIEFAVARGVGPAERPDLFGFLQIRPLTEGYETPEIAPELLEAPDALCATGVALGNGRLDQVCDVVYVPPARFDRGVTPAIAEEVAQLNRALQEEGRPYLLIGPGRWGSADRWLGIPVKWAQIAGARVIIETDLPDFKVTPSQGTHFFQNLTSRQVGYLTVNMQEGGGRMDWEWLDAQPAAAETAHARRLRLDAPLTVLIDGRSGRGVVLKPGAAASPAPAPRSDA